MDLKRMNKSILIMVIVLLFVNGFQEVKAQNATELKINELLVFNDSNYVDDFGNHSPWFEIFNPNYNAVNIGGLYLTDDLNDPKKYWIPIGDPVTNIPPRGYIVFFADNKPTHGILHVNFTLSESKTLALFNANGHTLIDRITIDQPQKSDVSYGRLTDGENKLDYLPKSTPNANNDPSPKPASGEKFVKMDPSGLGLTAIAMSVVFLALALLYIIYKNIGRLFTRKSRKKSDDGKVSVPVSEVAISGEINAAIAMALHLFQNELHDLENTVLTIRKVSRNYSPWSSKIYSIRKSPNN